MLSKPSLLSTPGRAASLTWKQSDMLTALWDSPVTTKGLSNIARDVIADDIHDGTRPYYIGTSPESIYMTMKTLQARGLVDFDGVKWYLTQGGRKVTEEFI